jgi:hypothetical protein
MKSELQSKHATKLSIPNSHNIGEDRNGHRMEISGKYE